MKTTTISSNHPRVDQPANEGSLVNTALITSLESSSSQNFLSFISSSASYSEERNLVLFPKVVLAREVVPSPSYLKLVRDFVARKKQKKKKKKKNVEKSIGKCSTPRQLFTDSFFLL